MPPPRLSVITTCRNRANFIERTICSVLDQAWPALQFLVVDRGSTDDTPDLIGLYRRELIWLSLPGSTPGQAINAALARAEGDMVCFVNDVLLPGTLDHAARQMRDYRTLEWLVGRGVVLDYNDVETGVIDSCPPATLADYLRHDGGLLPLTSTVIRRQVLEATGPFDEQLHHAHDYDYWCRLMAAGVWPQVTGTRFAAVDGGESSMSPAQTLQRGLEYIAVARRHGHVLSNKDQKALRKNCDQRQRIYALADAELRPGQARRRLWQQLLRHPWWVFDEAVRQTLLHGATNHEAGGERAAA